MTRTATAVVVAFAMATTLVTGETRLHPGLTEDVPMRLTNPPSALTQTTTRPPEATYVGCLRQGASRGVYLLQAATASSSSGPGGPDFLLQGAPSGFDMAANVNHRVEVTGAVIKTEADAASESNLPAYTIVARTAKSVADACSVP